MSLGGLQVRVFSLWAVSAVYTLNRNLPANCCQHELENNSERLECVVFSDECNFSVLRSVNKHYCHFWPSNSKTRFKSYCRTLLPVFLVGAVKMKSDRLIIFEKRDCNRKTFQLDALVHCTSQTLREPERYIFQQNDVSFYYAAIVRQCLRKKFLSWRKNRNGSTSWLFRSPEFTPHDDFLEEQPKCFVYREPSACILQLNFDRLWKLAGTFGKEALKISSKTWKSASALYWQNWPLQTSYRLKYKFYLLPKWTPLVTLIEK